MTKFICPISGVVCDYRCDLGRSCHVGMYMSPQRPNPWNELREIRDRLDKCRGDCADDLNKAKAEIERLRALLQYHHHTRPDEPNDEYKGSPLFKATADALADKFTTRRPRR